MKSFKDFAILDAISVMESKNIPFVDNIYRPGSEGYFTFFEQAKKLYDSGEFKVSNMNKEMLDTDIGLWDTFNGVEVPLDCPLVEEAEPELNTPKRGGSKKFVVYVRNPQTGNIKKIEFGDTSGLKVKINDKAARSSFAARHKCDTRNDKTKASYWACRLPKYAKSLGMQVDNPGSFW